MIGIDLWCSGDKQPPASSVNNEDRAPVDHYQAFKSSILAAQMDSRFQSLIQLSPKDNVNPYQLTLGRNPILHSNIFQRLLRGENQLRGIRVQNEHRRFHDMSINDQLAEFMASQLLTTEQARRRWQISIDLLFILREEYPSCQLYIFGSLLSGLGDPSSDIDIYMDYQGDGGDSMEELPSAKSLRIYYLQQKVGEILRKAHCRHNPSQDFCREVELIGTRVPIVRLQHIQTGVSCDISFGNRISVQNTKLFQFYLEFDPRVKPLIVFLRYWADFHGIAGSQKIKKYALSLLALVYLTKKKILPSISVLQTLAAAQRQKQGVVNENPDLVDGWDTSFCTDREMIDILFESAPLPPDYQNTMGNVLLLMALEFFELMLSTDLASVVVCPLLGKMIPRENFMETGMVETLPVRLKEWRLSYESLRTFCKETRIFKPLVILDPFVLDFNVGGLVDQDTLDGFCEACKATVKILKTEPKSILELFLSSL